MFDEVQARPAARFGFWSLALFGAAALWFCVGWQMTRNGGTIGIGWTIFVAGALTTCGLVAGIVGSLPGNGGLVLAASGFLLNGAGLLFVCDFIPGAFL